MGIIRGLKSSSYKETAVFTIIIGSDLPIAPCRFVYVAAVIQQQLPTQSDDKQINMNNNNSKDNITCKRWIFKHPDYDHFKLKHVVKDILSDFKFIFNELGVVHKIVFTSKK
jgi:hypothetical protein